MINFLQETNNPYILTHNKKINSENISYQVKKDLEKVIDNLVKKGINKNRLIIDPGFGFNKTVKQNIELHNNFDRIKINSVPILVGTSKRV